MSYTKEQQAAYMRAWRQTHPMTEAQRVKDRVRSVAGVYLRRGKIRRQPCRVCGDPKAQMHHPDYSEPLKVDWLCRDDHLMLHKKQTETSCTAIP